MTYEEVLVAAQSLSEDQQYKLCDVLIDTFPAGMKAAIRYNPDAQAPQEGIRRSHRDRDRFASEDFTEQEKRDMEYRNRTRPLG